MCKINNIENKIAKLTNIPAFDCLCYQHSLKSLLDIYDIKYSLFCINASSSCYCVNTDNNIDIRFHPHTFALLPKYSSNLSYYEYRNSTEAHNSLINVLNTGNCVVAQTDAYYLKHLPHYKCKHGRHSIILYDFSTNTNTYKFLDITTTPITQSSISYVDMDSARNSCNPYDGNIFSGIPINYGITYLSNNNFLCEPMSSIKEQIILSLQQYYSNSFFENTINGIYIFQFIANNIEYYSNNNNDDFFKLYNNLLVIYKRRLLLNYMYAQIYNYSTNHFIKELIDNDINIIKIFRKMLNSFLKYHLHSSEINKKILKEQLNSLFLSETKLVCILKNILHYI